MVVNLGIHREELKTLGYLDMQVDPTLDLVGAIQRLKVEKNAVLLAHYYQEPEIQDIADYVGDSLGLAQQAAKTTADIIVFAGVHFMAETAKILNPDKKVLLPDLRAGCSLSDSCPPALFSRFKDKHPGHTVISYINCSAEIKALSDIICTSANAQFIVDSLPEDEKIIFAPDRNLGAYINNKTGRNMVLWGGACMVHEMFSRQKLMKLKERYPRAKVLAHPECESAVLELADFIGSTTQLLSFSQTDVADTFIVVTEPGIIHKMKQFCPDREFIAAPPDNSCACNDCPHMKLNTLEKLYTCMKYELPEIILDNAVIYKAKMPIERMLKISAGMK